MELTLRAGAVSGSTTVEKHTCRLYTNMNNLTFLFYIKSHVPPVHKKEICLTHAVKHFIFQLLTSEFKRKHSVTLSQSCMETELFLLARKVKLRN